MDSSVFQTLIKKLSFTENLGLNFEIKSSICVIPAFCVFMFVHVLTSQFGEGIVCKWNGTLIDWQMVSIILYSIFLLKHFSLKLELFSDSITFWVLK